MFLVLRGSGYKCFDNRGRLVWEGIFTTDLVEFKEIIDSEKWSIYWNKIIDKDIRKFKNQGIHILAGNDLVYRKLIGSGEKADGVLQELLGEVPFSEGRKIGRLIKQGSGTVLAVVMVREIPETVAETFKSRGIGVRGVFWGVEANILGDESELTREQINKVHNFDSSRSWWRQNQSNQPKKTGAWAYWGLFLSLIIIIGGVIWKVVL
jgi:hypothetical protein